MRLELALSWWNLPFKCKSCCSYANWQDQYIWKAGRSKSTPAPLSLKGQGTKHTTVKWSIADRDQHAGVRLLFFVHCSFLCTNWKVFSKNWTTAIITTSGQFGHIKQIKRVGIVMTNVQWLTFSLVLRPSCLLEVSGNEVMTMMVMLGIMII